MTTVAEVEISWKWKGEDCNSWNGVAFFWWARFY
jgi:hypothetical protein